VSNLVVTGMSGLLGAEVARRAVAGGWVVTGTYHHRPTEVAGATSVSLDVRDAEAVATLFERVRPDAVVHTAYLQTGPASEATIVDGTTHVVSAARHHGARLVHMSTDLVFGGRAEPYRVDDPPDPLDDYGRAKTAAERRVLDDERAVVVRSSLLYSIERSCPAVQMVIEAAGNQRFFVDEFRCPTLVEDVATGLVTLAADDTVGIVHLNAASVVSRYDFARLIAAHHGLDPGTVRAGTIADHPARRPGRVALRPSVPGYRDASEVLRPRSS
jgi:dTDP-4-dehydrorhamnose reductase